MSRFGRTVTLVALLGTCPAIGASVARADDARPASAIAEVRAAMENAQFPRVIETVDAALASGRLEPEELRECYRLLGEALVALGNSEAAREAFSNLLVLEPDAKLGEFASPKITEELEAARVALEGQHLVMDHEVREAVRQAVVAVQADPRGMAYEAELSYRGSKGQVAKVRSRIVHDQATLDLPAGFGGTATLSLLDPAGNALSRVSIVVANPVVNGAAIGGSGASGSTPALWSRWWVWAAGSAGVAIVGGTLGLASQSSERQLQALLDAPEGHFYSEAEALEKTARTRATWANASFAAAGGLALVSAYVYWSGAGTKSETILVPETDGSGASLSLRGSF